MGFTNQRSSRKINTQHFSTIFCYSLLPKHLKQKEARKEHSEQNLNSQALILNYNGVAKL
jgi:hypothetical protein